MEEISEIAGSSPNYEVQDPFENSPSYEIQNLSGNTTEFTGSKYSNMETGSISSITENSKGSQVWFHFTKDTNYKINKIAICNYCSKKYVCSKGSTSNMNNYLKNYHANKLHLFNLTETSNTIPSFFTSTKVNIYLLFINFILYNI